MRWSGYCTPWMFSFSSCSSYVSSMQRRALVLGILIIRPAPGKEAARDQHIGVNRRFASIRLAAFFSRHKSGAWARRRGPHAMRALFLSQLISALASVNQIEGLSEPNRGPQ
ncbi:MAG: hypothetical protein EBT92_19380 [Planctomycetes bacterium]|nr:hypothetical protein [Planctomycetota bacterium]